MKKGRYFIVNRVCYKQVAVFSSFEFIQEKLYCAVAQKDLAWHLGSTLIKCLPLGTVLNASTSSSVKWA